jgi:hypothetical protein
LGVLVLEFLDVGVLLEESVVADSPLLKQSLFKPRVELISEPLGFLLQME